MKKQYYAVQIEDQFAYTDTENGGRMGEEIPACPIALAKLEDIKYITADDIEEILNVYQINYKSQHGIIPLK